MICGNCGSFFGSGKGPDGALWVRFTGKGVPLCTECLIHIRRMNREQRKIFFKRLAEKTR